MVDTDQKLEFYMQLRSDSSVDKQTEMAIRETVDKILTYKDEVNQHFFQVNRHLDDLCSVLEENVRDIETIEPTELDFNDVSMMAYLTHMDEGEDSLWRKIIAKRPPLQRYAEMYEQVLNEREEGEPLEYGFLPDELTDQLNAFERGEEGTRGKEELRKLLDTSADYIRRFDNLYRLSTNAESIYSSQMEEKHHLSPLTWGDDENTFSKDELKKIAGMCDQQSYINLLRAKLIHQSVFSVIEDGKEELENYYSVLLSSVSPYTSVEVPNTDDLTERLDGYFNENAPARS